MSPWDISVVPGNSIFYCLGRETLIEPGNGGR